MNHERTENRSDRFGAKAFVRMAISMILLLLCIGIALIVHPERPAITFLPFNRIHQNSSLAQFFIRWSWIVKGYIFRGHRTVNIDATILRTTNALGLNIATKGDAFSETNGIKLWLMTNARLHELQGVLSEKGNEILARPRVVTADGVEGSMYIGSVLPIQGTNRNVGLEMSVFPRTTKSSTDLTLTLLSTEAVTIQSSQSKGALSDILAIQTNLAVVARIQIPSGMGVLLISGAPEHNAKNPTNSEGFAVLVAVEAEKLNR